MISIHALLAESDAIRLAVLSYYQEFLSTLSLRRATNPKIRLSLSIMISIHALLAESDPRFLPPFYDFLISIHALLAESDE